MQPPAAGTVVLAVQLAEVPAAALFVDGQLRAAVREEVLTRRAVPGGFPSAAVDALLDDAGVSPRAVAEIVVTGLAPGGRLRRLVARVGGGPAPPAPGRADLDAALARARLPAPVRPVDADAARAALSARGAPVAPAALAVGAGLAALGPGAGAALPWSAPPFSDQAAYRALSNAGLPRVRVGGANPGAAALSAEAIVAAALRRGLTVAWARGPAGLLDAPLGPRLLLRPGAEPTLLVGPDALVAHSPVDVVRAFRSSRAEVLLLGDYVVGSTDG